MHDNLIFSTTFENFDAEVIQQSYIQPILVDIWADWCSPCLVIAPILEKVVKEFSGTVKLAKVDVDEGENMKIAGRYQARGFPTVLFIYQGEEKDRFYSAKPQIFIKKFVSALMP